jgi:outer membrane protein OmpA-like peptidoglycan-associated protein
MGTWTTKLRVTAAGVAVMAAIAAAPAYAAETNGHKSSKKEAIGVGSGAVIGALAGGPVGAIAGAMAGAWLGDKLHRESTGRKQALVDLEQSEQRNGQLAANVSALDASLADERARSTNLAQLLERVHELETDFAFRTEDSSLTPVAAEKLQRLGTLLAGMPETQVRVSGFADPRGTESYNLALSERRAEAVRAELAKAGVPSERLIVEAHGETNATSVDGDMDAQALERRVTVRVERGGIAVAVR